MNQILPQYQKFMAERKLAAEYQIPFYADWPNKFIRFSNGRHDTPSGMKIQLFHDDLINNPKIRDWQIAQAERKRGRFYYSFPNFNMSFNKRELGP